MRVVCIILIENLAGVGSRQSIHRSRTSPSSSAICIPRLPTNRPSPHLLQHAQHLRHLLTSLFPRRTDTPSLPPPIEDLLDDHSEGLSASGHGSSLAALREISFSSNTHTFSWQSRAPVGQFQPGDFGYLPDSGSSSGRAIDLEQLKLFEKLGNIFDEEMEERCNLDIVKRLSGSMRSLAGRHGDNQVATPYLLPGGLEGYVNPLLRLHLFYTRMPPDSVCPHMYIVGQWRFRHEVTSPYGSLENPVWSRLARPGGIFCRMHSESWNDMGESLMNSF